MVFSFLRIEHLQRWIRDYQSCWAESIKMWQQIKASGKEFTTLDFAQGIIYTELITDIRENSLLRKQRQKRLMLKIATWEIRRFPSLPWHSLWEVDKSMTSPHLGIANCPSKGSTTEGCGRKIDYCSTYCFRYVNRGELSRDHGRPHTSP